MKKPILILLNIIVLFFFISCSSSNFDPEKDEKVLREACEIPPLPGIKKEAEREIIRSHAGVVTKHYSHESGCPAIEKYYDTILKDRGWEKVPSSFFSNPDYIDFRKEDINISLTCKEIRDLWGIKRFSIDCSKGLR